MLTVVGTSDWHGSLPSEPLPAGDVLLIGGDTLPVWDHERGFQSRWVKSDLAPYLESLDFEHILLIAGNHDFLFQESKHWLRDLPSKVTYLQDDHIVIDGFVFHGSPWAVKFGNWAFMLSENDLIAKWESIPKDCHVLLVHGPPYGACDLTFYTSTSVGSKTLREKIVEIKPQFVICGHIHEGYGFDEIGQTLVANVSQATIDYKPKNAPFVFTLG